MWSDSIKLPGRALLAWKEAIRPWIPAGTKWVLLMFLASRLLLIALVCFSQRLLPRGPFVAVSRVAEHGGGLLDVFTQWDSVWYRSIAEHGYQTDKVGAMAPLSTGFFPLYPILIRAVAFLGVNYQIASVLVSNLAFVGAAILLYRLMQIEYMDERISRSAVTFLMFSPATFYFSAGYTEGTYLFFSLAAFGAAVKERWFLASLAGMCLSATRSAGFLIVVPLFMEYLWQWWQRGHNLRALVNLRLLSLALVPIGASLYMLYCYQSFGDPLAYAHAQSSPAWDRLFTLPWQTFLHSRNDWPSETFFFRSVVITVLALLIAGVYFKIRASYFVYALVGFIFPLCWTTLSNMFRYFSVLFPIYIVLALITTRHRWSYPCLVAFSAGFMTLCVIVWANAYGLN